MNQYFEQMILSATPMELVRLLFQKAIASTRAAREHLQNGRISERCAAVNNTYMVLHELMSSLRPDQAPDLARRLKSLYAYMQRRLLDANLKQQDEPLAEVLGLLMTLAEPWNALSDPAPPPSRTWSAGLPGEDSPGIALSA